MSFFEIIAALEMGMIYGIVAIAVYITFRIIDFPDLTVDGCFVTGAACCAIALKCSFNPFLALSMAIVGGMFAGLVTGVLNIFFRIPSLLSGIITGFMLYSINLRIMGGIPNLSLFDELSIFDVGSTVIILISIALFIWLLLSYLLATNWGLALRVIGQNPKLAFNYGVRKNSMIIIGLVISNALTALAGGLFCQSQGFADISVGNGTVIIGLAAIILGEKVLPLKSVTIALFACVMGSLLYRFIIALALRIDILGLTTSDLNLITGIIVISIMCLSKTRRAILC